MMSRIWQIIAAVGVAVAAFFMGLAKIRSSQRDDAIEEAEKHEQRADTANQRIEQRQEADTASSKAKDEGEKRVEEAVDRARTGRRDHFE